MTIGPLPPGLIRELTGGPLVVPLSPLDGGNGDPDGFAQALRTVAAASTMRETVERFNENGFFADAGAVPAAVTPLPDTRTIEPVVGGPPIAAATPLPNSIDTPAQLSPADSSIAADASATAARQAIGRAVATPVTPCPVATVETVSPTPTRLIAATGDLDLPVTPSSGAKPHPARGAAAKSPVHVAFDATAGAAAVAVSAPGLTDREAEALRNDIVALLRRHGLVLDDLKLNGRPAGQGKHDRSGG